MDARIPFSEISQEDIEGCGKDPAIHYFRTHIILHII